MTSQFPDTKWSMIRRACAESPAGGREEMGRLLQQYWRPMFIHLRYKGLNEQSAEDLIQDFAVELLSGDLLSVADPKKGRFRTLLLTALDRFAVSRFRYETAAKRSPGSIASLDQLESATTPDTTSEAGLAFERAWALDVLAETEARMELECLASGESVRWQIFQRRITAPLLEDAPLADYDELAAEYGLDNAKQAMNLVVTAKRQFARVLRDVIREYVTRSSRAAADKTVNADDSESSDDGDSMTDMLKGNWIAQRVEQELQDLREILGRSAGVSDLAAEIHGETDELEQRKLAYWNKLTHDSAQQRKPWGALFTLGTEQSDENLEAAFAEMLDLDLGRCLDVVERRGESIAAFLSTTPVDLKLLKRLKSAVNRQRIEKNPICPAPVANAMYYWIVAVGLVEHNERISGLDDPELDSALGWLVDQSWFSNTYRPVLHAARRCIQSGGNRR